MNPKFKILKQFIFNSDYFFDLIQNIKLKILNFPALWITFCIAF